MAVKLDNSYPGTVQHQKILRAIVEYYKNDQRVHAIAVFGSLGRGNWDQFSDIDLDTIIDEGVSIDVVEELTRLCHQFEILGESAAVIIRDAEDAGDIVLESLMGLSVRYHVLSSTSPNIVDSLRVLSGRIDLSAIAAAGTANRQSNKPAEQSLAESVRHASVVDIALQRNALWDAVVSLQEMRTSLMEIYTITHSGERAVKYFQANADSSLQDRLGSTLPQYTASSLQESLGRCLDILEHDLRLLSGGQIQLTEPYRRVLEAVRARQAALKRAQ